MEKNNPIINSKIIKSASLHKKLPFMQRTYTWPYLFIYPLYLVVVLTQYDNVFGSREWALLTAILLVSSQILLALMCKWSVNIDSSFTCVKAKDIYEADCIKIIAAEHQGLSSITPITFSESPIKGSQPRVSFFFQALKFIYDEKTHQFRTVDYPCDLGKNVSSFKNAKGFNSEKSIEQAVFDYGKNIFSIPIPSFIELFQEHAVAPFFVFQVFCVILWCLDEYWYYPIFTLFMLVVFESTVVFQRVRTLREFRSLSMDPFDINVYRLSKWQVVSTTELLPGDIVSIVRSSEDSGVPCDVALLEGNCIVNEAMLSGESTPQLKEALLVRDESPVFEIEGSDKNSVLYGGTKVLQIEQKNLIPKIQTPDGGAICLVLRTGFGTSQGELVRTMVHSTEQVSANNFESYVFILFLLAFAILASGYVWIEGTKDSRRSKTKILLDCILILTSVVPPELPMELSLSVNNSLIALSKYAIFCTEPFRIPYAGKLDVCCFDKTGTLTGDKLVVDGVIAANSSNSKPVAAPSENLAEVSSLNSDCILTLASTHALVRLEDGTLVGDPMEQAQLESTGFAFEKNGNISLPKKAVIQELLWAKDLSIITCRRFPFSSVLKMSSSLVKLNWGSLSSSQKYLVGVKGAPEAMRDRFSSVPDWYDETFKKYSRMGGRVLALGCKWLKTQKDMSVSEIDKLDRSEMESELVFQGFLVFSCPLKEDSKDAIQMLNESQHRCIMITGDNALTAAHVAEQVGIVERVCLILDVNAQDELELFSVDETVRIPCDPSSYGEKEKAKFDEIVSEYDLCTTGAALDKVGGTVLWKEFLLHHIWVYARVNPSQKEFILTEMKNYGYVTLMCGDGTNDVGALKQSHIGVALLNGTQEDLDKISERFQIERIKRAYDTQVSISKRFNQPIPPPPKLLRDHMDKLREKERERAIENGRQQQEAAATAVNDFLFNLESIEDEIPTIKFGDASVASPFTSKLGTIQSICNIVRQGRCTLVATIQMYKILALNSLISAYSMSVLYLEGIKYGDYQATIMGLMVGVCFMSISKAKPVEKLSRERPHSNILNAYVLLTVLLQFLVHIVSLVYVALNVKKYELPGEIDIDGDFKPSLLNTAMYLISLSQQISTFAINYQGHPFRESLYDNKMLYRGLLYVSLILVLCVFETFPALNGFMKLVQMPPEFKTNLALTIAWDFYMCFLVEKYTKKYLSFNQPKPISARPKKEITETGTSEGAEPKPKPKSKSNQATLNKKNIVTNSKQKRQPRIEKKEDFSSVS
ncbi:hypothetical protein BB560_006608 [Smittium megazygosporum]|uniref:Cation-transporting ATPase n=1 Tax=Smittium megazygosporum TaxID=133381 RepID=A0A2T9Y331_9FUNG|nr:hypothetical protein BB560_006608 [Smittium megazygosporum]